MGRVLSVLCVATLTGGLGCLPAAAQPDSAGPNPQKTQIAALPGNGGGYMPVAGARGHIYPVNNGNGHYICTPSGFGQIASCSLRQPY